MSAAVFEVGDEDFEREVLEASATAPVVVDFWAPWCGPCRNLGPLLERLAEEAAGAWRLAKVNVDESPRVASQFGVRSIPLVVGFRDGRAVSEFTGAQPEGAIRAFLDQVLPSQADELVAEGRDLLLGGQTAAAAERFQGALELEPRHPAATLGAAQVLAAGEQHERALDMLERLEGAPPEFQQAAEHLAAEIRTRLTATEEGGADLEALRARADANPDDLDAQLALGKSLAARREDEAALEAFVSVVERDRNHADEAARKAMLDLFELLGGEHELTQTYRSRLAQALFK